MGGPAEEEDGEKKVGKKVVKVKSYLFFFI